MTSSIQPRKQRRARFQAPMHERQKFMRVRLAKELRAKLGTGKRNMLLHKGDKVKLLIGDGAGKSGTVLSLDYARPGVFVEGITVKTARGVEKPRRLQPSNLLIIDGDFTRKDRQAVLARSKKVAAKTGAAPAKPAAPASKSQ